MPWHEVQYRKITCRTGPCGGFTCGRVGRAASCAATGEPSATTNAATAIHVLISHHFERLKPAVARPDLVDVDAVQMQEAEQHVRRPLRIVGAHEMAIPFERAIDAAEENHRHLFMGGPVRVAHVAPLVD